MTKIYTKTGDQGETGLFGNQRVRKNHPRLVAYGEVDELNSFIGFLISRINDDGINKKLMAVQENLFIIGAELATPKDSPLHTPHIQPHHVQTLEQEIDAWQHDLPPLAHFILPGGDRSAAVAHICRTICRRAERSIISVDQQEEIDPEILKYMNRLSDWFFILARILNKHYNQTEHTWNGKQKIEQGEI
ncbi:MAG: ATP:cob(I)alamin adenosyltransferase [Candidatus Kerfeldbacteria bacterium RIFCSPHIGHO2_12_FULL_48_17]|uniref:Corrinoid adenosyltransferase n=1 Tax=Candidatus Kerfeldbacteria bacterium RIFCSPHIGHO2_12_FULL_48_17 TaxID=1798542 RepID=A0A1G2B4T8_9BACT|nr:MAG: ATP:cob(I)alamin adenosyltransferase [Candidatus Kerfeldbacteria bacterium RIFCSPHIGHO2_12_FULL_48_17]